MPEIISKVAQVATEPTQTTSKVRWYSQDEVNNELISAYEKFKESLKKEAKERFEKNLSIARAASESAYKALKEDNKILCKSIHLRMNNPNSYDSIIVLPEKDYLSSSFDTAYHLSTVIRNKFNKNGFEIDFHFMSAGNKVNIAALCADGFLLTYKRFKK